MSAGYMRSCAGKRRHDNRTQANQHRIALAADVKIPKDALSVYQCVQCLGWHVGRAGNSFVTRQRRSGKRPNKRMRGRV